MDVYPVTAIDRAPRDVLLTIGLVLPVDSQGPPDVDRLREALFRAIREKVPRAAARIIRTRKVACRTFAGYIGSDPIYCAAPRI